MVPRRTFSATPPINSRFRPSLPCVSIAMRSAALAGLVEVGMCTVVRTVLVVLIAGVAMRRGVESSLRHVASPRRDVRPSPS
jgi:hypothetical protein